MAHALENVIYTAELLKANPAIHFIFVGAGAAREELIKLTQSKSLTNISFIPAQAKEVIADFWALCTIALVHLKKSTVFAEVIPSKIFEAMGMGLPIIIAAPEGEATSLVLRENVGSHVFPEDPKALANTVLRYQQNPELVKEQGQKSVDIAPRYNREEQARLFLNVLEHSLTIEKTNVRKRD